MALPMLRVRSFFATLKTNFFSAKSDDQPWIAIAHGSREDLKTRIEERIRVQAEEIDLFRSPTPDIFIPDQNSELLVSEPLEGMEEEWPEDKVEEPEPKSEQPEKRRLCVFFLSSKGCREGVDCPYEHPPAVREVRGRSEGAVCRFFLDAGCRDGEQCLLRHVEECDPAAAGAFAPSSLRGERRSRSGRGHSPLVSVAPASQP